MRINFITCSKSTVEKPLRVVVDLNIRESQKVKLYNGEIFRIKLLEVEEICDDIRGAIRVASAKVDINGEEVILNSGSYNLPVKISNVQIDCPVTGGYRNNSNTDAWGLEKDARFRLWPADSPWIAPGTFVYPAVQRWFADDTWMSNEPIDAEKNILQKSIYYHYGLDIGGPEEMVEVLSATDGLVVVAGLDSLSGYENTPVTSRYDVIYILDDRGWFYRYSHLYKIDPSVRPGMKVKMGQKIGLLGKEGSSGGWSHLHFDIKCLQPSGKWGVEDSYAYAWEAYVNKYKPPIIAVARPRKLAYTGQTVKLDGSKSRSFAGEIIKFEWSFSDGTKAEGPVQKRIYNQPGLYSEILKVIDSEGNIDYDFSVVHVYDKKNIESFPPRIQANYYPTFNIKPGDPIIFKARTFGTKSGTEIWDFQDGSPKVETKSVMDSDFSIKGKYIQTVHSFDKSGHYIVSVERFNENGYKATAHLHVEIIE